MSEPIDVKKSTIFYYEWNILMQMLPDDKQLILLKSILCENPERPDDSQAGYIFDFIKPKLDENFNKYKDIRQKRRDAANKRWNKDKKPTKEAPPPKKQNNSGKAVENMKKDLVELFTKPHFDMFDIHEDDDLKAITKFILDNSDNKDINNDHDLMDKAYVAIRKHLIKTHNIYALTYPANGKREPDQTTKEIHKHMAVTREQMQDTSSEQSERQFYDNFYDTYKGKTISILGVDYDVNWEEEQFFLKGTKKTGEFGSGRLQEEVWKMAKG